MRMVSAASRSAAWGLLAVLIVALASGACSSARQTVSGQVSPAVPLYDNLGSLHHPITTPSQKAQQYFDQGLRLVYAFNHEEAIHSFEEATRHDPAAAMPYWGVALALGPNINAPMDKEQERRAYHALQQALTRREHAGPKERAYIEALATRYSPDSNAKRETLDQAYADAMREVWKRYPDDTDAGTLFAEALMDLQPWNFWTPDGQPKGNTEEIVATLERVLTLNPDHPGACHYYIHAVEASPRPERALSCAERLPALVPGAGHLVHMPAHIYLRLGRYREAAERNMHAAAVDQAYLKHRHLTGIYPTGYYPHNLHFLWAALTMEGRSREAIQAARDLHRVVSWDEARKDPSMEEFTPTLLFALARFGKWNDVLAVPPPPAELVYTAAIWRYARGLAYAATGRFDEADAERTRLAEMAKSMPKDRTLGGSQVATLMRIADEVLAGEIAARRGDHEQAVSRLTAAIKLEDALRYYEPPLWHYPVRHSLGAVLLEAGRPAEAERIYREDLAQHPENGWALFGLAQSLKKQNKTDEAAAVEERFKKAWARADVTLTSSRF
ncbi:MAG: tetratricopeptide repeat protein [Nitrospirota bacterium]